MADKCPNKPAPPSPTTLKERRGGVGAEKVGRKVSRGTCGHCLAMITVAWRFVGVTAQVTAGSVVSHDRRRALCVPLPANTVRHHVQALDHRMSALLSAHH